MPYIAEFTSDIQHIAGTDNVVADTLSRPPGGATAGGVSESPRAAQTALTGETR